MPLKSAGDAGKAHVSGTEDERPRSRCRRVRGVTPKCGSAVRGNLGGERPGVLKDREVPRRSRERQTECGIGFPKKEP